LFQSLPKYQQFVDKAKEATSVLIQEFLHTTVEYFFLFLTGNYDNDKGVFPTGWPKPHNHKELPAKDGRCQAGNWKNFRIFATIPTEECNTPSTSR
jgi:hypothetical protein